MRRGKERPWEGDELVKQARARIGRGIQELDASHLEVADYHETPALLDQRLIAAFPDRETAELPRKFVLERSRLTPRSAASRLEPFEPGHGNRNGVVEHDVMVLADVALVYQVATNGLPG